MTNAKDVRRAHELLEDISIGHQPNEDDLNLLRSFLPEIPAQKTLEEITELVNEAWGFTHVNEWDDDAYGSLESWLSDLETQLQGVKDTPVTVPALPAGMRLADHAVYGRVVTSPKPNRDGIYDLLVPRPTVETGADWDYAHECELTFIDPEPVKPAHPEFLETEAEYQKAPEGTIVACEDSPPWHKFDSTWLSTAAYEGNNAKGMTGIIRRVLRWGNE